MTSLLAEKLTFWGFDKPFALIMTILGMLLTGIGWVGKKRLERWDEAIRGLPEKRDMIRKRLLNFAGKSLEFANSESGGFQPFRALFYAGSCFLIIGGFVVTILSIILALIFPSLRPYYSSIMEDSNWVQATLFICLLTIVIGYFVFTALIPLILLLGERLFSAFLWISMTPYLLTRWVEKEDTLERTFIFVGIGVAIVRACLSSFVGHSGL